MKLYKLFTVSGLLLVIAIFPACSKSSDNDNNAQQPVITLTAPSNNQVYTNGDNLLIQGTVTDNALHELRVKVTNGSTVLFSKTIVAHNLTSVAINESWKTSVSSQVNAAVTVEAEDLGAHIVTKTVNVIINL